MLLLHFLGGQSFPQRTHACLFWHLLCVCPIWWQFEHCKRVLFMYSLDVSVVPLCWCVLCSSMCCAVACVVLYKMSVVGSVPLSLRCKPSMCVLLFAAVCMFVSVVSMSASVCSSVSAL